LGSSSKEFLAKTLKVDRVDFFNGQEIPLFILSMGFLLKPIPVDLRSMFSFFFLVLQIKNSEFFLKTLIKVRLTDVPAVAAKHRE